METQSCLRLRYWESDNRKKGFSTAKETMAEQIFKIAREPFLGHSIENPSRDEIVDQLCDAVLNGSQQTAKGLARQLCPPKPRHCAPSRESRVKAWFDGACRNNPGGHSSYGAVVKRDGVTIFSTGKYLGHGSHLTNNVAEYSGAIAVFRFLIQERIQWATIHGDSQLVIKQLDGTRKAKRGAYMPYYREARELLAKLPEVRLAWIPRGLNVEADALAANALCGR